MALTNNAKRYLDKIQWRGIATQPSLNYVIPTTVVGGGFAYDKRSRNYADPKKYLFAATSTQYQIYNAITNGWKNNQFSTTINGTLANAVAWDFQPSGGPTGSISGSSVFPTGSATTTTMWLNNIVTTGNVEINSLADRGDGLGYILRVVDNNSGSSGKIEERRIIANTSGSTVRVFLDEPLTFTPTSGSRYELLSGKLWVLSTGGVKEWRNHDVATGVTSAALSTTNLPATVGVVFNDLVILDEAYVPYNRYPGEGFVVGASTYDSGSWIKNCLLATATAAGTITGQSAAGDASLVANQFRNFQIRVVEDTAIPTAVGQRRRINSHTAGPSAVYTLASNWTVTPSSNCKFVIENDNDKIIFLTNSTVVYNYNVGANAWDTTTWAARTSAPTTAGLGSQQIFGVVDTSLNIKPSMIYSTRAVGAGGNPMDVLDISAAATGVWSSFSLTPGYTTLITPATGMGLVYDGISYNGKFIYFVGVFTNNAGPVSIFRLDVVHRELTPISPIPTIAGNTADLIQNRLALSTYVDGTESLSFLHCRIPQNSAGAFFEAALIV